MSQLKSYADYFPEYLDYEQIELGKKTVNVKDIIGGNEIGSKFYNEDWSPKPIEYNNRYKGVENFVKYKQTSSKNKILDLGYVHLFGFYSSELSKNIYFVCNDGHRRVSVCHKFKISKIFAEITFLKKKTT